MQPSNSFLDTASWQSLDPSSRAARFGKAAEFNFIQQGFLLRRHLKGRHLGIDSSGIESNPSLSWLAGRNTAEICRDYARELPRAAGVKPEALPWSKPSAPWPTGAAGMALLSKRGEKIERRFAHSLDSSVPRRTILRGLAHNNKRYLCVNIGLDLGLILRKGTGVGRPPLPKRPLLAFGRWRRGCLDGGRPAASPRTSWLENPVPAPYHAWYFTNFPPTGGNMAFSTDSRSASSHFWSRQRLHPPHRRVHCGTGFHCIAGIFTLYST